MQAVGLLCTMPKNSLVATLSEMVAFLINEDIWNLFLPLHFQSPYNWISWYLDILFAIEFYQTVRKPEVV